MTVLLKDKIKRGEREMTKREKFLPQNRQKRQREDQSLEQAKWGFKASQYVFFPGVGSFGWEQVKITKWSLLVNNLHSTEFYTGINYHTQFTQGWCRDF